MPLPPTPARPQPQRSGPSGEDARTPPAPAAPPERTAPPDPRAAAGPPAVQHRPPTDLDEFLARAVDRQIAEQRALREAMQELTNAVRELQAAPASGPAFDLAELEARIARAVASGSPAFDPEMEARIVRAVAASRPAVDPAEIEARVQRAVASGTSGGAVDPAEIEARVSRAVSSSTDVLVGELRDLRSTVLPGLQRATEASSGSRAIEHDMAILRDAVGSLSADVEGIAQALIDLNAGLRDWADGIDENIEVVKDAVKQARDVAARAEELQADAIEVAQRRADRRADSLPLLPVEGELVDEPTPGMAIEARNLTSEIEQRVKETIELSLYLADQIESFDKAISNLGDLPTRLEGVISQALKRTLAARAKLDRDAETALDEAVATLDEHVATIGDLAGIAELQTRLESGLDAIAEAIDRSADGGLPRAGTSLARAAARSSKASARRKTQARKASKSKAKAAPKAKRSSKSAAAKRSTARRKRGGSARKKTPPEAEYVSLDADPNVPSVPDGD